MKNDIYPSWTYLLAAAVSVHPLSPGRGWELRCPPLQTVPCYSSSKLLSMHIAKLTSGSSDKWKSSPVTLNPPPLLPPHLFLQGCRWNRRQRAHIPFQWGGQRAWSQHRRQHQRYAQLPSAVRVTNMPHSCKFTTFSLTLSDEVWENEM